MLGYPQYVLYSLIAEAIYLAFVVRAQTQRRPGLVDRVNMVCLQRLSGLALAAVQILPTLDALGDSSRRPPMPRCAAGSLHPLNAVQLVAPYLFATRVVGQNTHELTFYVGIRAAAARDVAVCNFGRKTQPAPFEGWRICRRCSSRLALSVRNRQAWPAHRLTTRFRS